MSPGLVAVPDDLGVGMILRWAGDLDRDGRLDLIFEPTRKNAGALCVWLSSRAGPGEPPGSAACWRTPGC